MQTQSNFDQKNCRQARVAVVSFDSLGDSLLYILLAHNLHKNNFEVSYFGTVGYQLAEWMPNLRLLPYPDFDSMDEILAHYDLVLMSPPKQLRKRMAVDAEYLQHLRQRYLLICQKAPPSWDWNHVESLNKQLSPDVFEAVKRLIQASSSIRFKQFRDESAVDILMAYMQEKIGRAHV